MVNSCKLFLISETLANYFLVSTTFLNVYGFPWNWLEFPDLNGILRPPRAVGIMPGIMKGYIPGYIPKGITGCIPGCIPGYKEAMPNIICIYLNIAIGSIIGCTRFFIRSKCYYYVLGTWRFTYTFSLAYRFFIFSEV